jgi:hypothetical protein
VNPVTGPPIRGGPAAMIGAVGHAAVPGHRPARPVIDISRAVTSTPSRGAGAGCSQAGLPVIGSSARVAVPSAVPRPEMLIIGSGTGGRDCGPIRPAAGPQPMIGRSGRAASVGTFPGPEAVIMAEADPASRTTHARATRDGSAGTARARPHRDPSAGGPA